MPSKPNTTKWNRVPVQSVVDEYLKDLQLRGLSPRTITSYKSTLRGLLRGVAGDAEMMLGQLTPEVVKAYLTSRVEQETCYVGHRLRKVEQHKLSAYSLHHAARNLRAFGTWLARAGYPNPFTGVQLPKLPKLLIQPLTPEEIERLFSIYNPETYYGLRWQAMLSFLLDTGVRLNEMRTLRLEDLEMTNYRAKVCGKGNKERYIFFGNRTHRLLARYLSERQPEAASPYVFLSVDGELMSLAALEHIMQNARRKSGIARFHTHLTRHTFATNYATVHEGDVFGLQALLGHESLDMTRKYVHLAQMTGGMAQRRTSLLDTLETEGSLTFTSRRRGQKARKAASTQ